MADDNLSPEYAGSANTDTGRRTSQPAMPSLAMLSNDGAGSATSGATRVLWVGRGLMVLLTVAMLGLLGRVAQLQTTPDVNIAGLLDSQQSTRQLMGRRGAITDRRGRVLASTRVAKRLFVDPWLIVDRNTFSEQVGYTLGYDPVEIEKTISKRSQSRYIVIDKRMGDEQATKLGSLDLSGLATEPVLVRDYPQGSIGGQLLGFVGADGKGLEGLEAKYDMQLRPQPGKLRYLRDARRQPLWVQADSYKPQQDGQPIRLAIDLTIQTIAEKHLAQTVEHYGAKSGQLIVMQPYTGEILALANYPSFDPNAFRTSQAEMRRNRAVTDVFEPGSIFKPLIWAALTQLNAAKPSEMIDCTTSGVYRSPKGRRLRDAHALGLITWDTVLAKSSNIGMAIVAQRVGNEKLHQIVEAFGFGSPTGSGLPGEVGGLVNPLKQWNHYSETSIPMGQEIGVTALQITRAFCSIANGGLLITPTIEAVDPFTAATPIRERVLLPAIAAHTRQVLRQAVTAGTGRKAKSKLYAIFGKTGTAQLPNFDEGGYYQDRYVSSFVGGAPTDSPRLVVGCFINDPDKKIGHYGGIVAAPAVKEVVEESLLYLGVTPSPDTEAEQVAQQAVFVE